MDTHHIVRTIIFQEEFAKSIGGEHFVRQGNRQVLLNLDRAFHTVEQFPFRLLKGKSMPIAYKQQCRHHTWGAHRKMQRALLTAKSRLPDLVCQDDLTCLACVETGSRCDDLVVSLLHNSRDENIVILVHRPLDIKVTLEFVFGTCHLPSYRGCLIGLGPTGIAVRNERLQAARRPIPAQAQGGTEFLEFQIVYIIHTDVALRSTNVCHASKKDDWRVVCYPWLAPVIPGCFLMAIQQSTELLQFIYRNHLAYFERRLLLRPEHHYLSLGRGVPSQLYRISLRLLGICDVEMGDDLRWGLRHGSHYYPW